MEFSCKNCGGPITVADMSRARRFAICPQCKTLYNVAELTAEKVGEIYIPPPVVLPDNLTVTETPQGVALSARWNWTIASISAAFWLATLAFVVVSYDAVWNPVPKNIEARVRSEMLRYPWIAALPVLAMLSYIFLAGAQNSTSIVVDADSVGTRHGPLWWPGNQIMPRSQCTAILVHEGPFFEKVHLYIVAAKRSKGDELVLYSVVGDPEVALGIRDALRKHLTPVTLAQGIPVVKAPLPLKPRRTLTRVLNPAPVAKAEQPRPATPLELACRQCGAPIPITGVFKEVRAAICSYCQTSQDASGFLTNGVKQPRTDPGLAQHWSLKLSNDAMSLKTRVRPLVVLGWLALAVVCALPILLTVSMDLSSNTIAVLMTLSAMTAIGVVFGVAAAFHELQHSLMSVNSGGVASSCAPLPLRPRVRLAAPDIAQLYTLAPPQIDQMTVHGYVLMALTFSGERQVVICGFKTLEEALYIEQEAERRLGIKDAPVRH